LPPQVLKEAAGCIAGYSRSCCVIQGISQGFAAGTSCGARHAAARSPLFFQAHHRRAPVRLACTRQRLQYRYRNVQQPSSVHGWCPHVCCVVAVESPRCRWLRRPRLWARVLRDNYSGAQGLHPSGMCIHSRAEAT
jgi:hypothetical protein